MLNVEFLFHLYLGIQNMVSSCPDVQGGPKRGHNVRQLRLIAHIFKTRELICMIFGILQRRFVLNTAFNSNRIKVITESDATWRKSTTRILLLTTVMGILV